MASPPDNTVSLLVGGRVHNEWQSYEIESDLLVPADAWQVALGLPDGMFPAGIAKGTPVEVRVGPDTVMQGRIDDVRRRVNKRRGAFLIINGRDNAAVLVDCSAPIFVARQVSLAEVVAKVVRPLGISRIRVDADSVNEASEKINVEPGMTAWDAVQQAAEANGLWPWFDPDGTLVIGGPDYTQPPVASLILNRDGKGNNVLDLEDLSSLQGQYSEVTVLAQSHGTALQDGQHSLRATARDTSMSTYRPRIIVDGDLQDQAMATSRARKLLADSRLSGRALTAEVRGHRTSDGVLWQPGQRVHVQSDVLDIDTTWFLMARRLSGGRGRQTQTTLLLKEDAVWTLDAYKKRKGRKGNKLQAVIIDVS